MINFFYDSLETLKQVKQPTRKEIIELTIAIFVVVVLASLFFAFADSIFSSLYSQVSVMLGGSATPTTVGY